MSCNHVMSLSRGCCIHCGMPDPTISSSTDSITNPSADMAAALTSMAKIASEALNEVTDRPSFMRQMLDRLNKDTNEEINRQYKSLFLSTPGVKPGPLETMFLSGRRSGKSAIMADLIDHELANIVQVGGSRRDHVMATWPLDDNTVPPQGENPCRDISITYTEDDPATNGWTVREHLKMWQDLIRKPVPTINDVMQLRQHHATLLDMSLVAHPTIPDATLNLAGAKVEIIGSVFNNDTHEMTLDIAITPAKPIKMMSVPVSIEFDKFCADINQEVLKAFGGIAMDVPNKNNRIYAESIVFGNGSNLPHWVTWKEFMPDVLNPNTQYAAIYKDAVKQMDCGEPGFIDKDQVSNAVLSTGTDSWEVPVQPSFQQWWADSVNSMSDRASPDAPVGEMGTVEGFRFLRPNVEIREVDLSHLVPSRYDSDVSGEIELAYQRHTVNPHGEMDLPRDQPSFNQESIDWYTAVADQMLDQCERDGEDRGTTILRLTNALDRELPTQSTVRATYKKVGLFCIDIERFDNRMSLVIERKGWWTE